MKITLKAPVWEAKGKGTRIKRSQGANTENTADYHGWERSVKYKKLLKAMGVLMKKGCAVHYEESRPFPLTIAEVTVND